MANNDFTAADNLTPEQLKERFPDNCDPFGVWYFFDSESHNKWAVNDENGDGFTEERSYKTALIISDALKIRHQKIGDKEIILDTEQQKAISHALLIGLDSYGEIERISDEVGKLDLVTREDQIPDTIRPIHPTGANDTIGVFAAALRYMQPT